MEFAQDESATDEVEKQPIRTLSKMVQDSEEKLMEEVSQDLEQEAINQGGLLETAQAVLGENATKGLSQEVEQGSKHQGQLSGTIQAIGGKTILLNIHFRWNFSGDFKHY